MRSRRAALAARKAALGAQRLPSVSQRQGRQGDLERGHGELPGRWGKVGVQGGLAAGVSPAPHQQAGGQVD